MCSGELKTKTSCISYTTMFTFFNINETKEKHINIKILEMCPLDTDALFVKKLSDGQTYLRESTCWVFQMFICAKQV